MQQENALGHVSQIWPGISGHILLQSMPELLELRRSLQCAADWNSVCKFKNLVVAADTTSVCSDRPVCQRKSWCGLIVVGH